MKGQIDVYKNIHKDTSDKKSPRNRNIALLLAFLTPIGVHNYYLGHHMRGIAQTMLFIGLWFITPIFIAIFILPFYFAWVTVDGLITKLWWDIRDGDGFRMYEHDEKHDIDHDKVIKLALLLPFGLHNIYRGHFKLGVFQWSVVMLIISLLVFNFVFTFFLINLESLIIFVIPIFMVMISAWIEGILLLMKKR